MNKKIYAVDMNPAKTRKKETKIYAVNIFRFCSNTFWYLNATKKNKIFFSYFEFFIVCFSGSKLVQISFFLRLLYLLLTEHFG